MKETTPSLEKDNAPGLDKITVTSLGFVARATRSERVVGVQVLVPGLPISAGVERAAMRANPLGLAGVTKTLIRSGQILDDAGQLRGPIRT